MMADFNKELAKNIRNGKPATLRQIGERIVFPYNLYYWDWKALGLQKFVRSRGRLVKRFHRYKDLVAEAKRRTVAAGYPASRWSDWFDWNK